VRLRKGDLLLGEGPRAQTLIMVGTVQGSGFGRGNLHHPRICLQGCHGFRVQCSVFSVQCSVFSVQCSGSAHPVCGAIKGQGGLLALLRIKLLEPRLVEGGDRVADLRGRNLLEIRCRLGAADPSQLCGFGLRGEGVSWARMKSLLSLAAVAAESLRETRRREGWRRPSWEGNCGCPDRKVRGGEREASDRPHIQRLGGGHDDDHPDHLPLKCRMSHNPRKCPGYPLLDHLYI
jgi:hypothetical protein